MIIFRLTIIYSFEIVFVIFMAVLNDHSELYHLSYEVREALLAVPFESCLGIKCVLVKDELTCLEPL